MEFWEYFKLELSMGHEEFTEINWKFGIIYSNVIICKLILYINTEFCHHTNTNIDLTFLTLIYDRESEL